MQEIQNERVLKYLEQFPQVGKFVNGVLSNSTYGKFCNKGVLIGGIPTHGNDEYREFTFIFRMPVAVILKSGDIRNFIVEYSQKYRYREVELAIDWYTHELDRAILKNVSDIISRHSDINSIQFTVNNDPLRMGFEGQIWMD